MNRKGPIHYSLPKEALLMEYLFVTFDDDREVVVDDAVQGRTNEVLELERGTHTVTLTSPPSDFRPKDEVTIALDGTTAITPREVRYEKVAS